MAEPTGQNSDAEMETWLTEAGLDESADDDASADAAPVVAVAPPADVVDPKPDEDLASEGEVDKSPPGSDVSAQEDPGAVGTILSAGEGLVAAVTVQPSSARRAAASRPPQLDLGTIIVLESSPGLRRQMCEALTERGAQVLGAARLPDLLEPGAQPGTWRLAQHLRQMQPDMLITNVDLLHASARNYIRWMSADKESARMRLTLLGNPDKLTWLRLRETDVSLDYPPDATALPDQLGASKATTEDQLDLEPTENVTGPLSEVIRLALASAHDMAGAKTLLLGCVVGPKSVRLARVQRAEIAHFLHQHLGEKVICLWPGQRYVLGVVSDIKLDRLEGTLRDWAPDNWLPIPTRLAESSVRWGAAEITDSQSVASVLAELRTRINEPWMEMRLGE